MEKKGTSASSSIFDGKITKYEDLKDDFWANNMFNEAIIEFMNHTVINIKNLQDYINWFLFLRMMKQRYCKKKNPDGAYHVIAHMIVATLSKVSFSDFSGRKKVKESAK